MWSLPLKPCSKWLCWSPMEIDSAPHLSVPSSHIAASSPSWGLWHQHTSSLALGNKPTGHGHTYKEDLTYMYIHHFPQIKTVVVRKFPFFPVYTAQTVNCIVSYKLIWIVGTMLDRECSCGCAVTTTEEGGECFREGACNLPPTCKHYWSPGTFSSSLQQMARTSCP